jgi:hypothetical protein
MLGTFFAVVDTIIRGHPVATFTGRVPPTIPVNHAINGSVYNKRTNLREFFQLYNCYF